MRWMFTPPRFLHFTYYYNQEVSTEDQQFDSAWFKLWINDVNDVRNGSYDKLEVTNPFTHFTKLPYLYYELLHNDYYKYPIIYSPWKEIASGGSRMLILSQFFPNKTYDAVRWNIGKNITYDIDNLVDAILKNSYWQQQLKYVSQDFDIRALVDTETFDVNYVQGPKPDPYFYWINHVEFINPSPYVFSKDWRQSTDYVETYDYRPIVDKIERTYQLWDNMKSVIKQHNIDTVEDYKTLLDRLVFENLDFVKKWHIDFADK